MSDLPLKWTPITELPPLLEAEESTRITWDFGFPPTIDAERIELNVRRLGAIQAAAAFSASHVSSYQGETTQFTPGISSFGTDGTAVATHAARVDEAPKSKTHIRDDLAGVPFSESLMTFHFKASTLNKLNKAELASVVADGSRPGGKSREVRWASAINTALSESMRTSARQHLLNRDSRVMTLLEGFVYANFYAGLSESIATQNRYGMVFGASLMAGIVTLEEVVTLLTTGESAVKDRRWSLAVFGGPQFDRYFLATNLIRTGRLIRARE